VPSATAPAASSTHPPKRPGLLSPSLFGAGGSRSVNSTNVTRRRTIDAPQRPGAN
jgi:hypothetical protein